jgi:hypothetical protein
LTKASRSRVIYERRASERPVHFRTTATESRAVSPYGHIRSKARLQARLSSQPLQSWCSSHSIGVDTTPFRERACHLTEPGPPRPHANRVHTKQSDHCLVQVPASLRSREKLMLAVGAAVESGRVHCVSFLLWSAARNGDYGAHNDACLGALGVIATTRRRHWPDECDAAPTYVGLQAFEQGHRHNDPREPRDVRKLFAFAELQCELFVANTRAGAVAAAARPRMEDHSKRTSHTPNVHTRVLRRLNHESSPEAQHPPSSRPASRGQRLTRPLPTTQAGVAACARRALAADEEQ